MIKLHDQEFKILQRIQDRRERHLIYILERDGQKYFYKELGEAKSSAFKEQLDFQKRVEKSKTNIILPKLYDCDIKSEKKWGLWEYLEGEHLAEWRPKNIEGFVKWLEPVADSLIEMEKIKPFKARLDIPNRLIKRINQWSEKPIEKGLYPVSAKETIINLIDKNRRKIEVGFNHSDFVPWHMHEIKFPKFVLVDYENCKDKPHYYDLAYFYQRTYTKLGEPKLAQNFLALYKKKAKLPTDFENRFLPVLGQRIMGGFYDCTVLKDRTDLKLHQQLLSNFLKMI